MSTMTIVDAIGWSLLHFHWQASVIAVLLALLLPMIRARYAASSLANRLARIERFVGNDYDQRPALARALLTVPVLLLGSVCGIATLSAEPPANAGDVFLNVVGAGGAPATHNGVVEAAVGFPQTQVKRWSGLRDRNGLVSLAGLPDGSHALVLAPVFYSRTVFMLNLPSGKRVIDAPMRPLVAWRSTNLFLQATVHEDPRQGAIVRVRIENGTDEILKITERDICLEAGSPETTDWGLSPDWRKQVADSLPVTAIEPKQTGEIELKWRDWVREGLWYNYLTFPPRVEIGPELPDPKPGEISVRVWVRSHGVIPVALPHPSLAFNPQRPVDDLTEQLFRQYVVSGGKIPTASVNAAIELVAARGVNNAAFRETLLEEFEKSCEAKKFSTPRRNLLKVMRKMLAREGSWRWNYEHEQRTGIANQSAVPRPRDPKFLYAESKMLARLIARGRQSDRSDIDAFVIAIRAAHHSQGKAFLLDVLRNLEATTPRLASDVPRNTAPTTQFGASAEPKIGEGKWPDNLGGSWRDAKFHAAVALAELGEPEGVEWLIEKATPNNFGIDGSIYHAPHRRATTSSLRENCGYALADLSGLEPANGIEPWKNWWAANQRNYAPLPVVLRLD